MRRENSILYIVSFVGLVAVVAMFMLYGHSPTSDTVDNIGMVMANTAGVSGDTFVVSANNEEVPYSTAEQSLGCKWTGWKNRDGPSGIGDFETIADFIDKDVCKNPVAIECKTTSGVSYKNSGQVTTCNTEVGFSCQNSKNPKGCLDYTVRFCCPSTTTVVTPPIKPPVTPPTTTGCTDSDGGKDYFVKGTLTATGTQGTKTDYCVGGSTPTKLAEYYCSGSTGTIQYYNCPNGCSNGACVGDSSSNLSVSFSDVTYYKGAQAQDYVTFTLKNTGTVAIPLSDYKLYIKGNGEGVSTISWSTNVLQPGNSILARLNGGENPLFSDIQCANGAYFGLVHKSVTNIPPSSVLSRTLVSLTCVDTTTTCNATYNSCITNLGLAGCRYGVNNVGDCAVALQNCKNALDTCLGITNTCTDSDGGKDYAVKGYTTNLEEGSVFWDRCDSNTVLDEQFCDTTGGVNNGATRFELVTCPNGCSDGACVQGTTTATDSYPEFLFDSAYKWKGQIVIGELAPSQDTVYALDIAASLVKYVTDNNGGVINPIAVGMAVLDKEASSTKPLVIINSPCVNTVAAKFLNYPIQCSEGQDAGIGRIDFLTKDGQQAVMVSGYQDINVKQASRVLAQWSTYKSYYVSGKSLCVKNTGTNVNSFTVSACDPIVTTTSNCTDSDGALNVYDSSSFYIKGTTSYNGETSTDACETDIYNHIYLREYHCVNDGTQTVIRGELEDCPNGCSDGACLPGTSTDNCVDTKPDANEFFSGGTIYYKDGTPLEQNNANEDTYPYNEDVSVQVLSSNSASISIFGEKKTLQVGETAKYAVTKLKLVSVQFYGIGNLQNKVIYELYSITDFCSVDDNYTFMNFYCDASGKVDSKDIDCAEGCKDGACIGDPMPEFCTTINTRYLQQGEKYQIDSLGKFFYVTIIGNGADGYGDYITLKSELDDGETTTVDASEKFYGHIGSTAFFVKDIFIDDVGTRKASANICFDIQPDSADALTLTDYPQPFITKDGIATALFIVGRNAALEDVIGITDIIANLQLYAGDNPFPVGLVKFDDTITDNDLYNRDVVIVGGMCANSAAAKIYGYPNDCTAMDTPGVGHIKIIRNKNTDKKVLLIHGYSAVDTTMATRVLANWDDYKDEFASTGSLCVTGTLNNMLLQKC